MAVEEGFTSPQIYKDDQELAAQNVSHYASWLAPIPQQYESQAKDVFEMWPRLLWKNWIDAYAVEGSHFPISANNIASYPDSRFIKYVSIYLSEGHCLMLITLYQSQRALRSSIHPVAFPR